MKTTDYIYEVWSRTSPGFKYRITAKSSDQAKRIYCRKRGIKPSDYWCGLSNVSAKKIKD